MGGSLHSADSVPDQAPLSSSFVMMGSRVRVTQAAPPPQRKQRLGSRR